jgi:hypothetical protein
MPSNVESGKGVEAMGQISFADAEYAGKSGFGYVEGVNRDHQFDSGKN